MTGLPVRQGDGGFIERREGGGGEEPSNEGMILKWGDDTSLQTM